jgi:hypothetical protein
MTWRHVRTGFALAIALSSFGCRKGPEAPERVANEFLRAVKREDCEKAWEYFSSASQEKIRAESAEAIKREPYYSEQFKPENLYCKSTFANRFPRPVTGSARLQKIEGTNATVIAQRREPAGFALPGFSPMGSRKVPLEVFLVQENGDGRSMSCGPRPPSAM